MSGNRLGVQISFLQLLSFVSAHLVSTILQSLQYSCDGLESRSYFPVSSCLLCLVMETIHLLRDTSSVENSSSLLVTVPIPFVRKYALLTLTAMTFFVDLLQPVALSYWAHALGMRGDFRVQPEAFKAFGIAILIGVSYLVQAYYQDTLVSRVFLVLHERFFQRSE